MPPPVYAPPALKFLITSFAVSCALNTCIFTCTTDVACHLTAHVTPQRPIVRRVPYSKRGADLTLSSVTCFVEVDDVEQAEAGDTYTHTFNIPFPLYDHTYYWYLTGTISSQPCTSISQIFWHSCSAPTGPTPRCQAQDPPYNYHGTYRCYFLSSCFQPGSSYIITSCDITFQNDITANKVCFDGQFELWTAQANGKPLANLQTKYFTNPDLTPGALVTVNVPLTPTLLTAGSFYAIAYGFYDWWTVPRYKRLQFHFATNLTCEYNTPPAFHVWMRRYDSGYKTRCTILLQNWYTYTYDRNLRFKTYGTDPP